MYSIEAAVRLQLTKLQPDRSNRICKKALALFPKKVIFV